MHVLMKKNGTGTPPVPVYTLSSDVSEVTEGGSVTITLTTQDVSDGTEVPYTITGISQDDLSSGTITGVFTVNGGTANKTFAIFTDYISDDLETMTLALDNGKDSISVLILDNSGLIFRELASVGQEATSYSALGAGQSSDVFFNDDGTKMFIGFYSGSALYQYNLSIPFQVSSAVQNSPHTVLSASGANIYWTASDDGLHLLTGTRTEIKSFTLTTPWDFSTASLDSGTYTLPSGGVQAAGFSPDGTIVWTYSSTGNVMNILDLSVPFQVSTATHNVGKSATIGFAGGSVMNGYGMRMSSDGLYIIGSAYQTSAVHGWNLTTPYDFTTMTGHSQVNIAAGNNNRMGMFLNGDNIYFIDPYNSSPPIVRQFPYTDVES